MTLRQRSLVWWSACVFAACGESGSTGASPADDAGGAGLAEGAGDALPADGAGGAAPPSSATDAGEGGSSSQPPPAAGPTYWRDVRPLLLTECGDCHAEGEIGAFDLGDPQVAAALAPSIAAVTADGRMPPFPPGPLTPPLRDTRRLSAAQVALLGAWAAAGGPLGEPEGAPPAPRRTPSFDLVDPDLVFNVPVEP
jgi:hypothetical protein